MLNATQITNITQSSVPWYTHVHSITTSVPLIDSYKIAHARFACLCFFNDLNESIFTN